MNTINGICGFDNIISHGVSLRNNGDLDAAEMFLFCANNEKPQHWQPFYEISRLYDLRDEKLIAFNFSVKSLNKTNGKNLKACSLCCELALKLNNKDLLRDVIKISDAYDQDIAKVLSLYVQAFRYVDANTSDKRSQLYSDVIEKSKGWVNKKQIIESLKTSISQKKPFCIVRLGDGEGTWLYSSGEFQSEYYSLSERNRNEFSNIWFGAHFSKHLNAFFETVKSISVELEQADVIGVPPKSWINHEFENGSLRGMPGTLNVIKMLAEKEIGHVNLCTQLMHFELSQSKEFFDLIKSVDRVTVISCHSAIINYFKEVVGIKEVSFIGVPGEPSRAHLHGPDVEKGQHYPDVYLKNIKIIKDTKWEGEVCLIGAGILGKSYAIEIKKRGGIAIDVGSLMDKWLGKKTRPNFK